MLEFQICICLVHNRGYWVIKKNELNLKGLFQIQGHLNKKVDICVNTST